MKRVHIAIMTALLIIFGAVTIWAQATAQISGTVKDQTGAVLPGVEVTATQTDTGISRTTVTNETGSYVLPNLALGPYKLEATLPGFRTYAQTGIVLQVNSNPVVNPVMDVGQVSETVDVQANAAQVETRSVGVGQVIENTRIMELPLNGRNVQDLITLSGAAVQQGTTGNRSFAGNNIVSMAGSLGFGTAYTLDGIPHMDPYDGQSQPLPFPDALQEFKVETSGLSAQNAKSAAVSSVTKSGTNEFHGDLFEFVRNDLFNARNYFSTTHNTLKRNQFGGTIGGPVVHNKLFFFGGYQGTTIRQDAANTRQFVPTAAVLAGDFTAIALPACNAGRQITLKAPFVNNQVNPALFDKAAVAIASKLPKSSDPCGLVTFGQPLQENLGQYVTKVDYQRNAKDSMFGRFLFTGDTSKHPFDLTPDNILNTSGKGFTNTAQAYTFGDTYLVSANVVNAFRLSVSRVNVERTGAEFFGPNDVGINTFSYVPKYLTLSVTGGFSLGGGTSTASTFRTTFYQISDDISLIRGAHQLAFGGRAAQGRSNTYSLNGSSGSFSFNGQALNLGMADFFLGQPSSFSQASPLLLLNRQNYFSLYAQDTWKASPKLTVNYGLRWQPFTVQHATNNFVYNFDYSRFQQGLTSSVYKNAPAGLVYPGDPGFPDNAGYNSRWMMVSPRFGLAWDPSGDGHMSVRASYSFTYEDLPLQWRLYQPQSPPFGNNTSVNTPAGGLDNPWQGVPGGNPFPIVYNQNAPFVPAGLYQITPYDFKPPSTSSWNLAIQRQIQDWVVSASYLGTQTAHVWTEAAFNPAIFFPGSPVNGVCTAQGYTLRTTGATCSTTANTQQRRRLSFERPQDAATYIADIGRLDIGGTQSYNGMLLSVQRRATKGITVSGNYTLSHCIDDEGGTRGNAGQAFSWTETYQDPNNRRSDRGNCTADRRHAVNLTSVVATPQFSNSTLRMIGTGWRLSGIYRYSSGAYLTLTSGLDRALNGIAAQRPNQVLASPYGNGSLTNFLNPAAFVQPDAGTIGTMGARNVAGPAYWGIDLSLSRSFQVHEGQRLEFRAEAYNLTNSLRPGNPATGLNSNQFGQITSALDPRLLQFAMKYVF
jgi:carboxypeptidase family protein